MLTAAFARHMAAAEPELFGRFDAPGAGIFLEELPDRPAAAIAVMLKPGRVEYGVPDGYNYESIQILVRRPENSSGGGRVRNGLTVANSIRDFFNGLRHITLAEGTDDEVRLIWCLSDDSSPTNIGNDANGVPRWSLRFTTQTAHDTAHSIV